jgi:hypothetical protein
LTPEEVAGTERTRDKAEGRNGAKPAEDDELSRVGCLNHIGGVFFIPAVSQEPIATQQTNMETPGSMTRSSPGTDEEGSWSSEREAGDASAVPKLSAVQRYRVEKVIQTFWDVMNKNWRCYARKRAVVSGNAGASSASGSSQQSSSRTSNAIVPPQKNFGKRPANGDERDDEVPPPKRNRNDSKQPTDAAEKIKLSCPYRSATDGSIMFTTIVLVPYLAFLTSQESSMPSSPTDLQI